MVFDPSLDCGGYRGFGLLWAQECLYRVAHKGGAENDMEADIANKIAKINERQEGDAASPPRVITNLVMKSARANKAKNRYAGGKYAFLLLFTRKWLGDCIYEKMIRGMLRYSRKGMQPGKHIYYSVLYSSLSYYFYKEKETHTRDCGDFWICT